MNITKIAVNNKSNGRQDSVNSAQKWSICEDNRSHYWQKTMTSSVTRRSY